MFTLPENNFYRALLWLATVIVTILYSWLTSVAMAPSPTVPNSLVGKVQWVKNGTAYKPDLAPGFKWLEYQKMGSELRGLSNSMPLLGGLSQPIHLIINADEPPILRVNENQIEIGLQLAQADGQLSKAVLKTWILQNADSSISGSLLRTDAVSDALTLMVGSVSEIHNMNGKVLKLSKAGPRNWVSYMGTMRDVCESSFSFAELQALCKSKLDKVNELTPLSFRPLLAEWVLFHFETTPVNTRIEFLEKWASHLRKPSVVDAGKEDFYRLTTLPQWCDRLRQEVSELLPNDIAQLSKNSHEAELKARLRSSDSPVIEKIIVRGSREKREFTPSVYSKFQVDPVTSFKTKQVVWESCALPDVEELLNLSFKPEYALLVENCSDKNADLKAFELSLPDFAKANRNVAFAQLRIEGIHLALQKGYINSKTNLVEILDRVNQSKVDSPVDIFGLRGAKWKSEVSAYRAVGAIEAIDWFRPRSKDVAHDPVLSH